MGCGLFCKPEKLSFRYFDSSKVSSYAAFFDYRNLKNRKGFVTSVGVSVAKFMDDLVSKRISLAPSYAT